MFDELCSEWEEFGDGNFLEFFSQCIFLLSVRDREHSEHDIRRKYFLPSLFTYCVFTYF